MGAKWSAERTAGWTPYWLRVGWMTSASVTLLAVETTTPMLVHQAVQNTGRLAAFPSTNLVNIRNCLAGPLMVMVFTAHMTKAVGMCNLQTWISAAAMSKRRRA